MAKKTDKQSRLDHLSEKHSAIASVLKAQKKWNDKVEEIVTPLREQKELTELINSKSEFNPHGDYSIIYHNGIKHKLTPMQANAIRYMHNEHKKGKEEIWDKNILDYIGTSH